MSLGYDSLEEKDYKFNNLHDGEDGREDLEHKLKQHQENLCDYMDKCKYHYHKQCDKFRDNYEQCDVYQFFERFLK